MKPVKRVHADDQLRGFLTLKEKKQREREALALRLKPLHTSDHTMLTALLPRRIMWPERGAFLLCYYCGTPLGRDANANYSVMQCHRPPVYLTCFFFAGYLIQQQQHEDKYLDKEKKSLS